jgi:hypothetical protein
MHNGGEVRIGGLCATATENAALTIVGIIHAYTQSGGGLSRFYRWDSSAGLISIVATHS